MRLLSFSRRRSARRSNVLARLGSRRVTRRLAGLAIVGVLAGGAIGAGSAASPPVRNFSASVDPTAVVAAASQTFAYGVTNDPTSDQTFGSANVTVPSGFTSVSVGPAVAPPGKSWTSEFAAGGVVQLRAANAASALAPGESVSVQITATAPCALGSPAWNVAARSSINFTGPQFTLVGATPAVTVQPGPLASFSFGSIGTQTAGEQFAVQVTARDGCGNVKSDYAGGAVLGGLANSPNGTAPTHGALVFVAGVGSGNVTATLAQTDAALSATDGAVISTSDSFTVLAAEPAALSFAQQPTLTLKNTAISPAVAVEVIDEFGNPANGGTVVSIAIGANPGLGNLVGDTQQETVDGVATFPGLRITHAGGGYTLVASTATSNGPLTVTSSLFIVADVIVNCPPSGCSANASNRNNTTNISVTAGGGGAEEGQLALALDAPGGLFDCEGQETPTIGSIAGFVPPPGYTATNPLSVTVTYAKSVAPGKGVANFVFCKNDGPGEPYSKVENCTRPQPAPSEIPCISHRRRTGVGDLVITFLVTSVDPFIGGR